MDKMISCKDLGSECSFTACAKTEVELFRDVLEHGKAFHEMKGFSQECYDKIRSSIHEGYCDIEEEIANIPTVQSESE